MDSIVSANYPIHLRKWWKGRGGTYAAALETMESSSATAWKSGWREKSKVSVLVYSVAESVHATYSTVGGVAYAGDKELDLLRGIGFASSHL